MRWAMSMVAILLAVLGTRAAMQEKGGTDETGPYDVVENWFKPLHEGRNQCVLGVFAQTPDRIFVISEVEVPSTRPLGNCSSERKEPGSHSHFIMVVNRNGQVIEDWSQWNGLFGMPHDVEISPYDPQKHVWVVSRDTHQIHKFTNDGKRLVMTLGEKDVPGSDSSHFGLPANIGFLRDGSFVVADGYRNARVVKFDANGKFITSWGSAGSGPGQFKPPVHGVAVDRRQRIYVADQGNNRIQVFDQSGKFLDAWPNIRGPVYLSATEDDSLWVMSGIGNRLLKYDLNGKLLTYWGTANAQGIFPGSLYAPHQFNVDDEGSLYIADYRNHRLQKFTPKPNADRSRRILQRIH